MNIQEKITDLQERFKRQLAQASTHEALEDLRLQFLSRQGFIAELMGTLKELSADEKRLVGPLLNSFKQIAEEAYKEKKEALVHAHIAQEQARRHSFDVTAVKPGLIHGHLHPYTHVLRQLENVFISMGYQLVEGPELEDDWHNFQALNIPADHPARDMQDTFWMTLPGKLMRTQTSSVQIRFMEQGEPPFAMLATGRAYRNEAVDATHDFVFMQAEGLFVAEHVSMANLLATIKIALQAIFEKEELAIRVRPGYFPFVEPGVEVDMQCPFCTDGCSVCKHTKWIEIAGAGLVHPHVLKACGIDHRRYSGFAFGMGLTRLVMLKYGIPDLRLLTSSRIDFLEQF